MKTAGIMIDTFKRPVFEAALKEAGFPFEVHSAYVNGTTLIKVFYEPEQEEELKTLVTVTNSLSRNGGEA